MTTATDHKGLISLGQPEPSGFRCAAFLKASKEKDMKKATFTGNQVRVSSSAGGQWVFVGVRQSKTSGVQTAALSRKAAARLISRLALALSRTGHEEV